MKIGISSYTFTWAVGVPGSLPPTPMTTLELVAKAFSYQTGCVQIADNLPLHLLDATALERLSSYARQTQIDIEVGTRGLTEDNIQRYLGIASALDSPFLRVVVDSERHHPSINEIIAFIKNIEPELKQRNLILAIENHDRFKAREFEKIITGVGSNYLGICLDSVNSMGAGEGVETVVEILAPYTVNLHIKDFCVKRVSHKMGFVVEGAPAGKGQLNVKWLIEQVEKYGRCKSGVLELWTPPEDDMIKTIQKESLWADQSIKFLKSLVSDKTWVN